MSRWNDPRRDDNAVALKRRLAAARSGRTATAATKRFLPALLVLGGLGGALILYALA
jgi:hypothetical protein